jgi:hypothetical protein
VQDIPGDIRRTFGAPDPRAPVAPDRVEDGFAQRNNAPEGIRASHALEATRSPDDQHVYSWDGIAKILSTKKIAIDRPYTMLTSSAFSSASNSAAIEEAWRLYDCPPGGPTEAFAELLNRYGIPIHFDTIQAVFIAEAFSDAADVGIGLDSGDDDADRERFVTAVSHAKDGRNGIRWGYGIDIAKYRADVRRRR